MKLLIAYDGSDCSEAALDDLVKAGLPDEADALVLSVAEVWLPPPPNNQSVNEYADAIQNDAQFKEMYKHGAEALSEAKTYVAHAKERLKRHFPNWKIEAQADYGSPAWEILTQAEKFGADLIVTGAHGRSAVGRLFLGSISQKVLTEASCSVRVARGKIETEAAPAPQRILIGFDNSPGAQAAVAAVARRNWLAGSEIKLITATDGIAPTEIGRFVPPVTDWIEEENRFERQLIENQSQEAMQILSEQNLNASIEIHQGNPRRILIEEAQKWRADAIFVGANAYGSRVERFLLGSVSAAVAARAHCSVEIVRNRV